MRTVRKAPSGGVRRALAAHKAANRADGKVAPLTDPLEWVVGYSVRRAPLREGV